MQVRLSEQTDGICVHEQNHDERLLAADLKSKASFVGAQERRRTPLLRIALLHHRHTAPALIGEKKSRFGAVQQDDAFGLAQGLGRDAFVRLLLHGLELGRQRTDSVVQLSLVDGERRRDEAQQEQTD